MMVDTSVWIDYFNGFRSLEAERLTTAIEEGEPISIPGLVLTEILLGLRSETEASRIADLLTAFDEVPDPDRTDYVAAASIYRLCRSKGKTIRSTIDCVIAQSCIRYGHSLLTKDRDFVAIAKSTLLSLTPVSAA
jgi:predicted nucleic acid-binding protein